MAIYYEIRIAGVVPAGALRGFEQLAVDQETETMVRGTLPDQAAPERPAGEVRIVRDPDNAAAPAEVTAAGSL